MKKINKNTAVVSLAIKDDVKSFRSSEYNYDFNLKTGLFSRWGKTFKDDPQWSPFGPEIADIEISYGNGCSIRCPWCYKGNETGSTPFNMTLDKFREVFEKFPKFNGEYFVNQVALGLTSVAQSPEIVEICKWLRANNVIPNATINGADPLTAEQIKDLVDVMGAMAISVAKFNYEKGLNLIQRFIKAGAKQLNIHYVLHKDSIEDAYKLVNAYLTDERLKGLNAIVFLSLKPKNRGEKMEALSQEEYAKLIQYCLSNNIPFGSDSCGAGKVIKSFSKEQNDKFLPYIEPCEATHFSFYCDAEGYYFPCSFLANEEGDWKNGIHIPSVKDFLSEVWNAGITRKFGDGVSKCNNCLGGCSHFTI
jgi:hypothetical protein